MLHLHLYSHSIVVILMNEYNQVVKVDIMISITILGLFKHSDKSCALKPKSMYLKQDVKNEARASATRKVKFD